MAFWFVPLLVGAGLIRGDWNIPRHARKYLPTVEFWARRRQIPVDVLLAWASLESNFDPMEYNPEPSAVESWACEVAQKPKLWGRNPAFTHALATCEALQRGEDKSSVIATHWGPGMGWGSYGMLQVARIVATEVGIVAGRTPHERLFDLTVNFNAGTAEIDDRRRRLYGRTYLADGEWAWVRAAYVGGPGILKKNPAKAEEIARKFLDRLQEIRG